jgi:hypothetical protein
MKKYLLLLLMAFVSITISAQTFYEVNYYDKMDKQKYLGLMTYWDNENCTLRCVRESDTDYFWECAYKCEFQKDDDGVNYMIFEPVPEAGKEDLSYPYFVWTWTKRDASDQSESPYVVFDEDEVGSDMKTADYFEEIGLDSMDSEYIGQFYEEDEEMYGIITEACNIVKHQSPTNTEREDEEEEEETGSTGTSGSTGSTSSETANNGPVTMHFIMAAATLDETIGESVETDLKLAEPEFKRFAEQMNVGYKEHLISGRQFNKKNILKAINDVHPGSNDIVVFIYSGHGFRFDDDKDDYPNMCLTYEGLETKEDYLGVSEVYDMLSKKNARLTIVLSDCCNSKLGVNRREIESSALCSRGNKSYDLKKLERLFLNSSGSLKVTAAKAGQVALCDAKGGFLLTSFLNNIHSSVSAVSNTEPSWKKIVDNSREYVKRKTTGFDETGQDTDPQIVVRSIHIKESVTYSEDPNDEESDDDDDDDDDDSSSSDSEEDDDVLFDIIFYGILIFIGYWLFKKIFGKKK